MIKKTAMAYYDEDGEFEVLKKRPLLDDLWEDVKIRDAIAKRGGNQDASGRIHSHFNKDTGRHHILFAGKPELSQAIKKAFRSNEVEFEEVEIENYPGDEKFDKQKAREIMAPRVFRTLKTIREDLGLPEMPILEQGTIQIEETIERGFNKLLGKDKSQESTGIE
jgi:hypothetical protein